MAHIEKTAAFSVMSMGSKAPASAIATGYAKYRVATDGRVLKSEVPGEGCSAAQRSKLTLALHQAENDGDPPRPQQHAYWLCWVSRDGSLHHFYRMQLDGCAHIEHTFIGDSFVVLRSRGGSSELSRHNAPHIDALPQARAQVVCSFLPADASKSDMFHLDLSLVEEESHCEVQKCSVEVRPIPPSEYRIIVECPLKQQHVLPPHTKDWTLEYEFVVPSLPPKETFDPKYETVYVWGDLSFDKYMRAFPITSCMMNQIVPQVMCGHCLTSNTDDGSFAPRWQTHPTWVMQAQYFWMGPADETTTPPNGNAHALCGEFHQVGEGDNINTTMKYRASDGAITITIQSSSGKKSEIVSHKPFPHLPDLFSSWGDFFQQAQAASGGSGPLGRPTLNIEYKGNVKVKHLKTMAPLHIRRVSYPQIGFEDCVEDCLKRLYIVKEADLPLSEAVRLGRGSSDSTPGSSSNGAVPAAL